MLVQPCQSTTSVKEISRNKFGDNQQNALVTMNSSRFCNRNKAATKVGSNIASFNGPQSKQLACLSLLTEPIRVNM